MKKRITTISVMMLLLGSSLITNANASLSNPGFGDTVYNPIDDRQCSYEIYCNSTIGEVGIAPEHVIIDRFGSNLGWNPFRFSNKIQY